MIKRKFLNHYKLHSLYQMFITFNGQLLIMRGHRVVLFEYQGGLYLSDFEQNFHSNGWMYTAYGLFKDTTQ